MSDTPFRDAATQVFEQAGRSYVRMAVECDEVRSHSWWRNYLESDDPWRVSPPDPSTWAGFAKMFETTEGQVKGMIAADWFGVQPDVSARTLRFAPDLDALSVPDANLARKLVRRLART